MCQIRPSVMKDDLDNHSQGFVQHRLIDTIGEVYALRLTNWLNSIKVIIWAGCINLDLPKFKSGLCPLNLNKAMV